MKTYLVVGGVAGGAAFAAKMRRLDENAEIIIFEKGPYISYANCGLPYYIGDTIKDKRELLLHTPETLKKRYNINVLVNTEVVSIDRNNKYLLAHDLLNDTTKEYFYDKVMFAPGGYAVKPPIEGIDLAGVFTIKDVPDTFAIKEYIEANKPKKAAVIGGGFIGLEMAENLHAIGLDVTVLEASPQVMGPLDPDMASFVHKHLKEKNIDLQLNTAAKGIKKEGSSLILDTGSDTITADLVIIGIGVKPQTKLADAIGLAKGTTGAVLVDEYMRTSDENIYASGDVVEVKHKILETPFYLPLAGVANKQARVAAMHIAGEKETFDFVVGTSVVKVCDITVATTGANEKQLKNSSINYDKVYLHPANHAGYYPKSSPLHIKLLFEKTTGRILGGQIIGEDGADKRIDVLASAIMSDKTVEYLEKLELAYAPPYSSTRDPLNYAGAVAKKVLKKDLEQFFWHDCESLDKETCFLFDARTSGEYRRGTIENAPNIPVDDIRDSLSKIPRDKEIHVFCHSGLRSYLVCEVLKQAGYKVKNLSGGYETWSVNKNE